MCHPRRTDGFRLVRVIKATGEISQSLAKWAMSN
jgi:hypothetical protein